MVQSKGTRAESHLLSTERTGKEKYAGRSADSLRLAAGGESAARRAMPTSGACAPVTAKAASHAGRAEPSPEGRWTANAGGGQSAADASGAKLPGGASGAGLLTRVVGHCSGSSGKRDTEVVRTWRRRAGKPAANGEEWEERTGDMAHLVTGAVFRFLFALSTINFRFFFVLGFAGRRRGRWRRVRCAGMKRGRTS